jgi:riboflavin kinase/FMN adenylyltransferase
LQVYRELKKGLMENTSLALGVFDGVHAGHQKVITDAVKNAHVMGLTPAVVTFSAHPRGIISAVSPDIITPLEDKLRFFHELGVEAAVIIDFTEELAKMTAEEYLKNILQECLGVKSISVGYNHKLGSDRRGTSDFLKEYGEENNIHISIIPPVKINDHTVSSSVIRGFIISGDVSSAREFLGRPFKVRGEVIKGQQLGKKIGFPTANLLTEEDQILPLRGVYSGIVRVKSEEYNAVINVGRKPTIGNFEKDIVEAHILNFDRHIYGEFIEVFFLERIRDEKKFDSLEELKKQIELDCSLAAQYK